MGQVVEMGKTMDLLMQTFLDNSNIIPDLSKEYMGDDGELHCLICNERTTFLLETPAFMARKLKSTHVRCLCRCERDKQDAEESRREHEEKMKKILSIKASSLMEKRFADSSFDKLDMDRPESFKTAVKRASRYCSASQEVYEKGLGIYFFGESGVGKTEIMACMANNLMDQEYSCIFTNFFEIAKSIKNTYSRSRSLYTEADVIGRICEADFLFIDDIGTERVQKDSEDTWLQEKIYDVINRRYNKKLPTVFSSNLTLQELIEQRGIMQKTVDRITEMSNAILKIDGESYRFIKRKSGMDIPF